MTSVKEIESAVADLPQEELAQFRQWFQHYDAEAWDRQIEQDVASGRLDALAEEATDESGCRYSPPYHAIAFSSGPLYSPTIVRLPVYSAVVVPARAARSHSASFGRRNPAHSEPRKTWADLHR